LDGESLIDAIDEALDVKLSRSTRSNMSKAKLQGKQLVDMEDGEIEKMSSSTKQANLIKNLLKNLKDGKLSLSPF